jgi:MHS family proline/betaine transporter-like MFS transporter
MQTQAIAAKLSPLDRRRAIMAASVGQFFELYDFSIYGFFAPEIGRAFFPAADQLTSLIAAFATYGVGFIMRPVGAIVVGAYGDRAGRKAALVFTVALMGFATGLVAFLPTYNQIGIWAPISVVILRLAQGFSTGGEWGGAAAFLVEHAPVGKRGFIGSFHQVATQIGNFTGFILAALLASIFTTEVFQEWGWRIAFLIGALLTPVGYYLRTRVAETPVFQQAEARKKVASSPLRVIFTEHWQLVIAGISIAAIAATGSITFQIFLSQFARQQLKLDAASSLTITAASLLFAAFWVWLIGALSDRTGRKTMVLLSVGGFLLLTYPLLSLLTSSPSLTNLVIVQFAGAILYGTVFGVIPTLLPELFPTNVRYTGISLSIGFAQMIFGGTSPFINSYLVQLTGNPAAPAFWVMAVAAISGIAMLMTKDRTDVPFD